MKSIRGFFFFNWGKKGSPLYMELKASTYSIPTFVLIKITNSCALIALARLKGGEGHSKMEKDLVKYYFDS